MGEADSGPAWGTPGGGPAWGTPGGAAQALTPADLADHLASLEARISSFRETVDALPRLRSEAARVDEDLTGARVRLRSAQDAAEQAAAAAGSATFPGRRAWAALLTGRYRAQRDAARAASAQAFARADACEQDVERLAARAGRARSAVQAAVDAVPMLEDLVEARGLARLDAADDPRAARVRAMDAEVVDLAGRLREVDEAVEAVNAARAAVDETLRRLRSAHSWGTYDTFFGGGLISSAVKHDRIAAANQAAAGIGRSLDRARAELADVRLDLKDVRLTVDPLHRGLDIWFDNIFSDWAMQSRIKEQQDSVARIGRGLAEVLERLGTLRGDLERRRSQVRADRRALLAGV